MDDTINLDSIKIDFGYSDKSLPLLTDSQEYIIVHFFCGWSYIRFGCCQLVTLGLTQFVLNLNIAGCLVEICSSKLILNPLAAYGEIFIIIQSVDRSEVNHFCLSHIHRLTEGCHVLISSYKVELGDGSPIGESWVLQKKYRGPGTFG
jgi:hypothetical protein